MKFILPFNIQGKEIKTQKDLDNIFINPIDFSELASSGCVELDGQDKETENKMLDLKRKTKDQIKEMQANAKQAKRNKAK